MHPNIVSQLYIVWVVPLYIVWAVPLSQLYIYWIKIQPWANKKATRLDPLAHGLLKTSHGATLPNHPCQTWVIMKVEFEMNQLSRGATNPEVFTGLLEGGSPTQDYPSSQQKSLQLPPGPQKSPMIQLHPPKIFTRPEGPWWLASLKNGNVVRYSLAHLPLPRAPKLYNQGRCFRKSAFFLQTTTTTTFNTGNGSPVTGFFFWSSKTSFAQNFVEIPKPKRKPVPF